MNTYNENIEYVSHASEALLEASVHDGLELAELHRQGQRIGEDIRIFADTTLMGEHAVVAARLQGFVDVVRNEAQPPDERQRAALLVMENARGPGAQATGDDVEYMFNLWRDMPIIDREAQKYWRRLEEHGSEDSQDALLKLQGKAEITEEDWRLLRIGVDVPSIVNLSQHVNVESIFARSALLLDRVATATMYDSILMRDILEIETVYAPLLDLLGLHASEALLRHHCEKARLMATGRDDIKAMYVTMSQYIESVREDRLFDQVMTDIVGIDDLSQEQFDFIVDNEETPYGSKSYFSAIKSTSEADIPFRFISRIKSPGSAVDKMIHHYKGEMPQDIYAGTVVVENVSELVAMFKEVYGNIKALEEDGVCELVTARKKERPIHIKGKKAYMESIKTGLGNEFEGMIDEGDPVGDDIEEPFQVLKVTFNMQRGDTILPVEIQFQTIADRNSSRLGGASHLSYHGGGKKKSEADHEYRDLPGNEPGNSNDMWSVNERKWAMLEQGGDEELYHEKSPEEEQQRIEEVRKLQELFWTAAFYPEDLTLAA